MSRLSEKLLYNRENGLIKMQDAERDAMNALCEKYKSFLNECKTERECVKSLICIARQAGFREYERGAELASGDRVYANNRGKSVIFAVIGKKPMSEGINLTAAHIDAPRIDIKQNPLYEDSELALLKTHYYGGIKKYQWPCIPLALHGVVALKSGEVIDVVIGEDESDPEFVITDLLPHLGKEQMKKTIDEGFSGESLNVLIGSQPLEGEDENAVKLNVLKLLNEKYSMTEEDFLSAELCVVPAFKARDIGFDRSMIGAYGHDDRVCAYPAFTALLDCGVPEKTAVCVLADKEEIGSEGVSGMKSEFFDAFIADLCRELPLHVCFGKSACLSADVTAAFDPNFPEVSDKRNNAFASYGVTLCKYTGSRGKSGASDASAEFIARLRRLFDEAGVVWQLGELGKVDAGGGGTVAMYTATRNIDTIDAGVPVLSMHSPFEVVSKFDVYMTYKAMKSFYLS